MSYENNMDSLDYDSKSGVDKIAQNVFRKRKRMSGPVLMDRRK